MLAAHVVTGQVTRSMIALKWSSLMPWTSDLGGAEAGGPLEELI